MAVVALANEGEFYPREVATARFYMQRLLPRTQGLIAAVKGGSETLYGLSAEQF